MEFNINQFVLSEKDGIYQDLSKLDDSKSQIISFYVTHFTSDINYKILFVCNKVNETNGHIDSIDYFGNKVIAIKTGEVAEQLPMTLKITIYNK